MIFVHLYSISQTVYIVGVHLEGNYRNLNELKTHDFLEEVKSGMVAVDTVSSPPY